MQPEEQPANIKSTLDDKKSPADGVAILITNTLGTIGFLIGCVCFFTIWVIWNMSFLSGLKPFDQYPFAGLEMVVSVFAIILSVSVLISQNRQGRMEKLRQQVEFEVNVRAENEITKMLQMLHEMQKKMGIDSHDTELENMKEKIDLEQLHRQMDDSEPKKEI